MIGCCRLCKEENTELRGSHIISKMFFAEIKKKSPTGYMRSAGNPNKSVQDGLKVPFLCNRCEELFSKYETYFSNQIYQKTIQNKGFLEFDSKNDMIRYFILSISWRILQFILENDEMTITEEEIMVTKDIAEKWRVFLVKENIEEIRRVQMFIIPTAKLSFFDKIDFRRRDNVGMNFKTFDKENTFQNSFILAQVPHYIFLTSVWGSMKQYSVGCKIKAHDSLLPKNILNILADIHFNKFFEAHEKLSDKQLQVIKERVNKNK